MNVRLFVAIEITEEIRKKFVLFQNTLKKADADVGWVSPENFHITLKFIGYLEEEKIDTAFGVIKDSVVHIKPFDLDYIGVGVFPNQRNPRVIFIDVIDPGKNLTSIHQKLDNQLVLLGVEQDNHPFEAHLTVGRVKTRRNINKLIENLNSYNGFNFGLEHVIQVVLMKSTLSQKGPIYTKLQSINLVS
jgi:2'-5' RNA ligase